MNLNPVHVTIPKIVVFDLDETLGTFYEFSLLWDFYNEYYKQQNRQQFLSGYSLGQTDFNALLDLYTTECIRPMMFHILEYLKLQKINGICDKVIIFTNNQGPRSWAHMIQTYFETKLQYPLFDQIVGAYKVNDTLNEPCRTSHDKKYTDFLQCTELSEPIDICFVDDLLHKEMLHPNVFYIKVNPFECHMSKTGWVDRFLQSPYGQRTIRNPLHFKRLFMEKIPLIHGMTKTAESFQLDIITGKRTFQFIQQFLNPRIQ